MSERDPLLDVDLLAGCESLRLDVADIVAEVESETVNVGVAVVDRDVEASSDAVTLFEIERISLMLFV